MYHRHMNERKAAAPRVPRVSPGREVHGVKELGLALHFNYRVGSVRYRIAVVCLLPSSAEVKATANQRAAG
jgi:hypothetical protein